MNKKIIYNIIIILFIFCNVLDAMYHKALIAMQGVTAGILIGNGFVASREIYNEKKKDPTGIPMPRNSQKFIRSIMRKCKHPQAELLPLLIGKDFPTWSSYADKAIGTSKIDDILLLESSLRKKDAANKQYIDLVSIIIKHETYHNMHKDVQCLMYANTLIPLTTEGTFFLLRSTMKKICNIKPPKKIISTCIRSSIVLMAFALKSRLNKLSLLLYRQQLERNADKFACEHAETREELEEFCNFFMNEEIHLRRTLKTDYDVDISNESLKKQYWMSKLFHFLEDPLHPCPMDRALMIVKYIDKWDEEHKN